MPIPVELATHIDASGLISRLPSRLGKKRRLALGLLEELEPGRTYSEKAVNEIFGAFVVDFALIRRILVDEGHLSRDGDGSRYQRTAQHFGS